MCIVLMICVTLTACGTDMNSVQIGKIDNEGNVKLSATYKDEANYARIKDLLSDATNVKMEESQLNHFSRQYIQLFNERQNALVTNYYLWDDEDNERFICRPYYDSPTLFYEIKEQNYRVLKRQIAKVKSSEEEMPTHIDNKKDLPIESDWTYGD